MRDVAENGSNRCVQSDSFGASMSNLTVQNSYALDMRQWTELLERSVSHRPDWICTLFLAAMFLTFVFGVIGNLITCVVIYFDKTMHTATNYYLFNLAISDLLVAFGILLEISGYMRTDAIVNFQLGDIVCKVHFFLVVTLWNNGVLVMTVLAIERYFAIWHPLLLNSRPVWRRVTKNIVLIWMVAFLEALPEIWTIGLIKTQSFTICYIVPTTFARWVNIVLALVTFAIPLGIMIFVYTMIAFKVNVTQKVFNHRNNSRKVNKLIVALTLSFFCCWLPFFGLRVLIFTTDLRKSLHYLKNWDLLLMLSSFNGWFSIVLNPMLFSLMSTKFRKALKTMWNGKFKMKQSGNRQTQQSAVVV